MNKMFKFNGMPYKRSGRAGGKSVSMIGMLVLLLAALLVLPSCFDDDEVEVEVEVPGDTVYVCPDGTEEASRADCDDESGGYDVTLEEDDHATHEDAYESGDSTESIAGSSGVDYIYGQGGKDKINGMGGDDVITGDEGVDELAGDDGDDVIRGGAGGDTIDGGPDDDEIWGGPGSNTIDGGPGDDIVIYLGALQATVNLGDERAIVQHEAAMTSSGYLSLEDSADSGTGNDTLVNIENVKGTHGNDRIDGDENANLLKGLDGADIINGHEGDDIIIPNRPMPTEDAANDQEMDGVDVVDGGGDNDTISYEGEVAAAGVTVNLGTVVEAVEAVEADPANSVVAVVGVIAHVAVSRADNNIIDMIKVVDESMEEDEEKLVSTIENLKGGAGNDVLTGDARVNRLYGGAGNDELDGDGGNDMLEGGAGDDMLTGGAGIDTLVGGVGMDTFDGGAGDDTYVAEAGETVTEVADGGMMDTVHYAVLDDPSTMGEDESEEGVTVTSTPTNVEVVTGTQNDDTITANADGVTILGLEGDDMLTGGAGIDTLVGCAGENTLTGAGGNDYFGVFKDDGKPDTITDFDEGDEIHLKGFGDGTVTVGLVPGNSTHAGVSVDGDLVAIVTSSTIEAVTAMPGATPPVVGKSLVEAIIEALGEDNAAGDAVVRPVPFEDTKCSSS